MTEYAMGTEIYTAGPWDIPYGGKALCSDGKVRSLKRMAQTADTFFSIPASVTVKGKTVTGYVMVETVEGYSCATDDDPAVIKFVAYTYRKNHALLPEGRHKR